MKYTTFAYEMIRITKGFVKFNKYAKNFNFHNETKTALSLSHSWDTLYTECPRRKGPNFGRVFLRSN